MSDGTDDKPSAPASLVSDRDGGDGHQQSEEEELLVRISKQRELIDGLPGDTRAGGRAPKQKKLGQLEFQYHMLMERKRLSAVLAEHQEKYGALYSEPCLLCLEDIFVHASENLTEAFPCCGGFICTTCRQDWQDLTSAKCPLCRETFPPVAENAAKLMALAERGVAWAQKDVGRFMMKGTEGFKKKERAGLKWLNKAVAQNYPPAMYLLAVFYGGGLASVLRKSQEKANELLLKSANLGYVPANSYLSNYYSSGKDGFERDPDETNYRASVAIALDSTFFQAAFRLGLSHHYQELPEPSPYLACYYLNVAAIGYKNENGTACYFYGKALVHIHNIHNGKDQIPGFNVAPAAFFWLRKSRDMGYNGASEQLKKFEVQVQSYCANCSKEAHGSEKFKQCSKCKAQWYCSRECQVEAWRAGHKKDCKRAGMLKFEDYVNAE